MNFNGIFKEADFSTRMVLMGGRKRIKLGKLANEDPEKNFQKGIGS
jgi:hypothetical protein